MLYKQAINSLEISTPKDFDHLCNRCANGKSHQLSMPGTSSSHYSKIKLLVMDLTGPMSVSIWDRFLYTLVVVEVSYHYTVEHLLCNKEKAGPTI